ncbi:hypothetical protein KR222_000400 [Zaprionus bogoriensis]|nr:hypothetical protein KR222_000400 [Zaprionus bogoriensis]
MCLKLSLLLLGLSLSITLAFRVQLSFKTSAQVQGLRSESLALADLHQDVSKICFDYYNPKLVAVVTTYEKAYNSCMVAYEAATSEVTASFSSTRISLEASSSNTCQTISCCNQTENAYKAFKCASTVAVDGSKTFYDISATAAIAAEQSKALYRQVDSTKAVCVSDAERQYVESNTFYYTELNNCLLGKSDVPATAPPDYGTTATDWPPPVPAPTVDPSE